MEHRRQVNATPPPDRGVSYGAPLFALGRQSGQHQGQQSRNPPYSGSGHEVCVGFGPALDLRPMQRQAVLLERDYLKHGAIIGSLFGMSFLFLYWGLVFTDVARSVIFIYTHPFWVAIAAHFVLPNERLTWTKIVRAIRGIRWFNIGVWRKIFHFGASVLAR